MSLIQIFLGFLYVCLCIINLLRFLRLNNSNNPISTLFSAIFDTCEVNCACAIAILMLMLMLPRFTHTFLMLMFMLMLMLMSKCEPALSFLLMLMLMLMLMLNEDIVDISKKCSVIG